MKRNTLRQLLFIGILLLQTAAFAQKAQNPFDIDLWKNGMPNSNGFDTPELFDDSRGNFKPSIRLFLPDPAIATGRAVIACPGGGYNHLAMHHEGYDWAPYFNKQGIALIVLKYRMPKGGHYDVPLSDVEEAMRTVKANAGRWHINPNDIGIMGFSAGGHLASTAATHSRQPLRPAFQILFYPVITMDKKYTHMGSHDNLLGKDASPELEKLYSNEKQVGRHTPRAFIVLSDDERTVPTANGVNYYLALNKKQIPASLHVYPSGEHGWGIREEFLYKTEMQAELTAWLNSFKSPQKDAIRVACMGNSITYGAGIRYQARDGYPAVLGRLLGEDYWVGNFGQSGSTLLGKANRPYIKEEAYREALDFCPDIVVLKLGTNDSKPKNWKYKADFANDLQAMIDTLKQLPSHPKIYLCYPAKAYKDNFEISEQNIVNEVIPIIRKVAKKNRLETIDLHTAMDGMPENFPDGIHPNEKGAEEMAKIIYRHLKK